MNFFQINSKTPSWMQVVLKLAALYNIAWGAWVVIDPQAFFQITGLAAINHPMIWQGMGMVIGVYGIGYYFASFHPLRHWPIVAVGMLGKFFGPIGFLFNYLSGSVGLGFGLTLITNDLIWWIPFLMILKEVHFNYRWKLYNKKKTNIILESKT
jgi:small multidrug resistance pump